ncbi:GntR family transcriptional regulator [Kineococcus arenarius]|uniref:GntR family transcriptional regulator n=1 Tax=unclassified Kineococcus TaxID=2621656 RepID=UPI003D7DC04A
MSVETAGSVSASLLTDQVFTVLREEIVNGELPAGTRLRVRDVAARVGTSVMPVREAIRRLEEAGLADREPHRGAVVRGVTLSDLLHIYDIRILLETDAALRGCAGVGPDGLQRMTASLQRMHEAVAHGQAVQALDEDEELLRELYQASGNDHLVELIEGLWRKCRIFKIFGANAALESGDMTLWTYQEYLVGFARSGDGQRAARTTRESLLSARRRIEARLRVSGTQE